MFLKSLMFKFEHSTKVMLSFILMMAYRNAQHYILRYLNFKIIFLIIANNFELVVKLIRSSIIFYLLDYLKHISKTI